MISVTGLASLALLLATSYVVDAAGYVNLTNDQIKVLQTDFKAGLPQHDFTVAGGAANIVPTADLIASADNFRRHTPELFTDMTPARYTEINNGFAAIVAAAPAAAQPAVSAELYSLITPNDIKNIQKERVNCSYFRGHVQHFGKKVIDAMNWGCLSQVITALPHASLQYITDGAFKEGMLEIVTRANVADAAGAIGVFAHLTEKQISAIDNSKNENVWRLISVSHMNANITRSKLRAINAEAYSFFTGHQAHGLPRDVLRLLKEDIYSKVSGVIHPVTLSNMTPAQLSHFNEKLDNAEIGEHLDIQHVSPAALSKITPSTFAKYLENYVHNKIGDIGNNFSKLSDNILSEVKDFITLEKLNTNDWLNMKRPQFDTVVKNHPEACKFVPTEMADSKHLGNLRPESRCFKLLPAVVQASLVAKHLKDMPENILSGVTSESMADWYHNKGSSFAFVEAVKLDPKYLAHLGSTVCPSDHPCILFDNKADLLASKHLMKNMGPHCFNALTILSEFDEKEMKEFPERVYALSAIDVIQKNAPGFFTKVDSVTLGLMVQGDNFCAQVDQKTLATIPAAAFSAMTYKCMQGMKKQVSSLSEAQLSFLSEETVKSIDAEMAKSLVSVAAFKAPQLKVLNASAFSSATKEVVAKLTAEQLAVLSADQLAAIPAASFVSFTTKEQIAAIRPEALLKVVFEQIKEVKEEALLTLSPAQIRSLGKSVTDASKKPAKIFTEKFISKLPKESAEAAKEVAITSGAVSQQVSVAALAVIGVATLLL